MVMPHPDARAWSSFLSDEAARRDKRHAFLWTTWISSLVGFLYLFGKVGEYLWVSHTAQTQYALGIGALAFLVLVGPVTSRLIEAVQPAQTPIALNFKQGIVATRLLRRIGFPWTQRATQLPEILGLLLAFNAVATLRTVSPSPSTSFFLISLGMSLVVALGVFLLRGRAAASLISFSYLFVAKSNGLDIKEGKLTVIDELWENVGDGILSKSLRAVETRATRTITGFLEVVGPLTFGGTIVILFLQIAPLDKSFPEFLLLAEVCGLVLVGLFSLRLVILLVIDNTRTLVEQLRLTTFLGELEDDVIPMAYLAIDAMQRFKLFPNVAFLDLFSGLRLGELARADLPQRQLTKVEDGTTATTVAPAKKKSTGANLKRAQN